MTMRAALILDHVDAWDCRATDTLVNRCDRSLFAIVTQTP